MLFIYIYDIIFLDSCWDAYPGSKNKKKGSSHDRGIDRCSSASKSRSLSEPNMRWYLGGQLVSLTGTMLQSAVLALLIVSITSKSEAATWTGVVWALGLLPGTFFGPFAGILLDRWDKRKVLMATGAIGTLQALCLAYLSYTGQISLLYIIGLAFIMGFINAVDGPGRNVIVKDAVVDKRNVRQASKMFTSLYNLAQIAGPGFAGYLVITFGYSFTFLLNALCSSPSSSPWRI